MFFRWRGIRLQKATDEELVDSLRLHHDALVSWLPARGQLQTIQRAFTRQRFAPVSRATPALAFGVVLTGQRGQDEIASQLVVIIEVLVAQGQPIEPLGQ
jgi:diphthamide synthase subunit DPH2